MVGFLSVHEKNTKIESNCRTGNFQGHPNLAIFDRGDIVTFWDLNP